MNRHKFSTLSMCRVLCKNAHEFQIAPTKKWKFQFFCHLMFSVYEIQLLKILSNTFTQVTSFIKQPNDTREWENDLNPVGAHDHVAVGRITQSSSNNTSALYRIHSTFRLIQNWDYFIINIHRSCRILLSWIL